MRLLLVTRTIAEDGGVARHVRQSCDALRAAGHVVSIVTGDAETETGLSIGTLRSGVIDPTGAEQVRAFATAVKPDAVHLHHVEDEALVTALQPVAPIVISAHGYPGCAPNTRYFDTGHECWLPYGPRCLYHMLVTNCKHQRDPRPVLGMYRETGRRLDVLRTSDAVVCYSSAVERHLEVNGIKSSWRVPLFSELVEAPATYDAEGPITYIGRIVQAKGVDILIRAAPLLNREVAIFGDGWAADGLRDLVAANGVEDRVTFHGWASPSVRESAYQAASVVAVPSRWPEPFGLVGLEAFAHARPVVASETGGISDWLEHGVSGLQVDVSRPDELANAINRIINDPALGERMGQAGRRSSMERFSPDAHVRELEKVYAAVKR